MRARERPGSGRTSGTIKKRALPTTRCSLAALVGESQPMWVSRGAQVHAEAAKPSAPIVPKEVSMR